jgi:hypothetical protein
VFVTGVRNKTHDKRVRAHKHVDCEKNGKIFVDAFCKELMFLWMAFQNIILLIFEDERDTIYTAVKCCQKFYVI